MAYSSQYPPAFSATYVKATSTSDYDYPDINFYPYRATDPSVSLTSLYWIGSLGRCWFAEVITNQRFHIDLGSAKTVTRIYYENFHNSGTYTNYGIKDFTFWGSNTAGAFAELTYATDTNWTQLTTAQSYFDQHVALNQADPKYILVTNTTAYRYYAFKIANAYRGSTYDYGMGVRRIELQITVDEPEPPSGDVVIPQLLFF